MPEWVLLTYSHLADYVVRHGWSSRVVALDVLEWAMRAGYEVKKNRGRMAAPVYVPGVETQDEAARRLVTEWTLAGQPWQWSDTGTWGE